MVSPARLRILPDLAYRQTVVEILHIVAGLVVAVAMTWAAAWSYRPAWTEIWWCGAAAMAATVAMGVRPLRRAWHRDRVR